MPFWLEELLLAYAIVFPAHPPLEGTSVEPVAVGEPEGGSPLHGSLCCGGPLCLSVPVHVMVLLPPD